MSEYAFNGVVVRLTHDDHEKWYLAYKHLDLDAELCARDAWLAEQPKEIQAKWFASTSMYLANRNMKAMQTPAPTAVGATKKERCYSTPQFKPEKPIKQLPQAERAAQVDRIMRKLALARIAKNV